MMAKFVKRLKINSNRSLSNSIESINMEERNLSKTCSLLNRFF